ncbi:MAG: HDOD domain-containing protein [Syntrophales bacterium]
MGIINIKNLKADMVLAGDVTDSRGRLLICKGTTLNAKHLRICKMWGVVEADVQGISSDDIYSSAVNTFDAATIASAEEIVHQRFCHTDDGHPAIKELIRLCTLFVASGRKIDQQIGHDDSGRTQTCEEEVTDRKKNKPPIVNPTRFIKADTTLSTLPDIYSQLIAAIARPTSSAYDIEKVVRMDTNLSARLLKIVNSAFYGYPSRIESLSRAVNIVGTKQLSTLAIGVNIIYTFKDIPSDVMNMEMFWKHSILCGICARILAGYKNLEHTERLFIAGLLHDIGRLVLYNYLPQESLLLSATARNNGCLLVVAERDLFNFDHATLGGDLLNKWQLSLSLEDNVRNHHAPQRARNRTEASIVHLADIMANAMGIGSSGERFVPPLHEDAWIVLGITPNIVASTIEQAEQQLQEVFELFLCP